MTAPGASLRRGRRASLGLSLLTGLHCRRDSAASRRGRAPARARRGGSTRRADRRGRPRAAPVTVSGTTLDGAAARAPRRTAGKVVVLNYWGSWCAPCVKETPDLKAAWRPAEGQAACEFLGLDAQEDAQHRRGVHERPTAWPTRRCDRDGGQFLLQLKGKAPAPADHARPRPAGPAGRPGARRRSTRRPLVGLVDDVLAEPRPGE